MGTRFVRLGVPRWSVPNVMNKRPAMNAELTQSCQENVEILLRGYELTVQQCYPLSAMFLLMTRKPFHVPRMHRVRKFMARYDTRVESLLESPQFLGLWTASDCLFGKLPSARDPSRGYERAEFNQDRIQRL